MAQTNIGVPVGKVKVTMNLDRALVKRAKIRAVTREQTCGSFVEKALHAQLAKARGSAA